MGFCVSVCIWDRVPCEGPLHFRLCGIYAFEHKVRATCQLTDTPSSGRVLVFVGGGGRSLGATRGVVHHRYRITINSTVPFGLVINSITRNHTLCWLYVARARAFCACLIWTAAQTRKAPTCHNPATHVQRWAQLMMVGASFFVWGHPPIEHTQTQQRQHAILARIYIFILNHIRLWRAGKLNIMWFVLWNEQYLCARLRSRSDFYYDSTRRHKWQGHTLEQRYHRLQCIIILSLDCVVWFSLCA